MSSAKKMLLSAAGVGGAGLDISEVFSTFLFTGTGANKTITNGIDLDGEGGLVWIKGRSLGYNNVLTDTERGVTQQMSSNQSDGQQAYSTGLTAFNSNGFSIGSNGQYNNNTSTMASWTFRKAPKFFDVVTYTGNGQASNNISHDLNSIPAFVISKRTDSTGNWNIAARQSDGKYISGTGSYPTALNVTTGANVITGSNGASDMNLTSTTFDAKRLTGWNSNDGSGNVSNINNATYVAYLFAHNNNDGEFGPAADQDIIKCGSISGANGRADLGFEPQWVLLKQTNSTSNWILLDVMRGWTPVNENDDAHLFPNLNSTEADYNGPSFDATGFNYGQSGENWIYMAIRAPMITPPAAATNVFDITAYTGNGATNRSIGGLLIDMNMLRTRDGNHSGSDDFHLWDRLRGPAPALHTSTNGAEETNWSGVYYNIDQMTGWRNGSDATYFNNNTGTYISYVWKRAKDYFDVVTYNGNGTAGRTVNHSLGVAPEMMWVKNREDAGYSSGWAVYHGDNTNYLLLNEAQQSYDDVSYWNDTSPTSEVFSLGVQSMTNKNNTIFIAYLFASLAGISKVGSVSHSGSSTDVDCGFSNGARFVMLKRTDAAGDWYVWDSVRGIIAANDPYVLINTTAVETTNTDLIDPLSSGFQISGDFTDGDYIFYAIA